VNNVSRIISELKTRLFADDPVATTTSTGSVKVNAENLVKTDEAKRQIRAMRAIANGNGRAKD
jgi:hypothetical protein